MPNFQYRCVLYINYSDVHVFDKNILQIADVACDFKDIMDVENPSVFIMAPDTCDDVNYIYIPQFNRYYFAKPVAGHGTTITYECTSDPLMSFKQAIKNSPAVISRNPWEFDLYLPDPKLPIESRTVKNTIPFPVTNLFDGDNNCYVLTTIGPGGEIIPVGGE